MPSNREKNNTNKSKENKWLWPLKIFLLTFFIAGTLSTSAGRMMQHFDVFSSVLVLIIIMLIGVIFDAIGISVTAASEVPLLSMASKRKRGAMQAVELIRNADRVSSFCNDVVGDICGIISGSAGSILVIRLTSAGITWNNELMNILISSLIAAFTVGGKALGKTMAIRKSQNIVYYAGYIMSFFKKSGRRKGSKGRKERKRI